MPGGDKEGRRHGDGRAGILHGAVTEGLAEEVALGQELQAKGQASAEALRQPVFCTLPSP